MKKHLKLFLMLLMMSISTACTTTSTLNRGLVHEEKIKVVKLKQLVQNISVEVSDSSVNGALTPLQEKINDIDFNKVMKNALVHNLSDGRAFSENVLIDSDFDQSIKKPFLIPVLTPSIVIAADFNRLTVSLDAVIAQRTESQKENSYISVYTSLQTLDSDAVSKRKDNMQYWMDYPVVLKEKIVDGLYSVAKQFAADFNAMQEIN